MQSNSVRIALTSSMAGNVLIDFYLPNQILTSSLKLASLIFSILCLNRRIFHNRVQLDIASFSFFSILCCLQISAIINNHFFQPNLIVYFFWGIIFFRVHQIRHLILLSIKDSIFVLLSLSLVTIVVNYNPQNLSFDTSGYWLPLNIFLKNDTRQFGVFTHPNTLAQISVFALFFYFYFKENKILLMLSLLGITASGSRTYEICYILLIFLNSLYRNKSFKNRKLEMIFPMFFLLYLLTTLVITLLSVGFKLSVSDSTFTGRGQIWLYVINSLSKNYLFGLGPNYIGTINNLQRINSYANSAHSIYLELLVSGGVISVIFLCILLSKIFLLQLVRLDNSFYLLLVFLIAGITETIVNFSSFGIANFLFLHLVFTQKSEKIR